MLENLAVIPAVDMFSNGIGFFLFLSAGNDQFSQESHA
jgi:hypothetical protein